MKITAEKPLLLAIESSCDDSSVAIIDARSLECVFYETLSQAQHSQAGGVVPELASRLHTAALPDILAKTKRFLPQIAAVAATTEPGLSVSLQSGVACAKALSATLGVPLIGVNHLKGHICSLFLNSRVESDFVCLLVSGGHTLIIKVNEGLLKICASTSDDSLGESFDKTAKMLGGPYPGGAWVSAKSSAYEANKSAYDALLAGICGAENISFSVPLKGRKDRLEYSFSGLKNQVRLSAQLLASSAKEAETSAKNQSAQTAENALSKEQKEALVCKICYEFERAACEHIVDKLLAFLPGCAALGVVGGASANARLRAQLERICNERGIRLLLAPLKYCSDNALMIARAAVFSLERDEFVGLDEAIISPKSRNFTRL